MKENLVNSIAMTKNLVMHSGQVIKGASSAALDNPATQGIFLTLSLALTKLSAPDITFILASVGSLALIFKLIMDARKSKAETTKTNLEIELLQQQLASIEDDVS